MARTDGAVFPPAPRKQVGAGSGPGDPGAGPGGGSGGDPPGVAFVATAARACGAGRPGVFGGGATDTPLTDGVSTCAARLGTDAAALVTVVVTLVRTGVVPPLVTVLAT